MQQLRYFWCYDVNIKAVRFYVTWYVKTYCHIQPFPLVCLYIYTNAVTTGKSLGNYDVCCTDGTIAMWRFCALTTTFAEIGPTALWFFNSIVNYIFGEMLYIRSFSILDGFKYPTAFTSIFPLLSFGVLTISNLHRYMFTFGFHCTVGCVPVVFGRIFLVHNRYIFILNSYSFILYNRDGCNAYGNLIWATPCSDRMKY